jgi:hypothetical protein
MFWGISQHFVIARTSVQNGLSAKRVELVHLIHKFGQLSHVKKFRNERTRSTTFDSKTHVLACFRTFRYYMNFGAKRAEMMQLMYKFMPQSRVGIVRNKCSRSTTLDAKLMFADFRTVSLLHEPGRTSAMNAQVHAMKLCQNFSQRTLPIHPIGPQTHDWCFSDHFITARTFVQNATKSPYNFSQRTHPIHPMGPRTHVLGRLRPFHYCTNFRAKRIELVPLMHKFVQ